MNVGGCVAGRRVCLPHKLMVLAIIGAWLISGCAPSPRVVLPELQTTIDRKIVEYPAETEFRPYIEGLTAPTAIAFDPSGALLIAEGGYDGHRARIFGFRTDGSFFEIYPHGRQLPFGLG